MKLHERVSRDETMGWRWFYLFSPTLGSLCRNMSTFGKSLEPLLFLNRSDAEKVLFQLEQRDPKKYVDVSIMSFHTGDGS